VGFKIKTYEVDGSKKYLVDKLEEDVLIPNLQCLKPCRRCRKSKV